VIRAQAHSKKQRGYIDSNTPPILSRLNINPENWLTISQQFEGRFGHLVGSLKILKRVCDQLNYKRIVCAGEVQCPISFLC